MERTKLLTIAVIGLLLLNLLTVGFLVVRPMPNRPPHPDHPPGQSDTEGPETIIIERLHFDPTQQKQYHQLVIRHRSQARDLNGQMVQLYKSYYGLLASDQPDSVRANALSKQIATNQGAQAELNFDHFKQISALCRPDQQADFHRLVSDLSSLFDHSQHPPRPNAEGPPESAPENLPSHP